MAHRLAEWGASIDLQLAGLCHAAYGTDGFGPTLLGVAQRSRLSELIGAGAEALVYRDGSCDRAASAGNLPAR